MKKGLFTILVMLLSVSVTTAQIHKADEFENTGGTTWDPQIMLDGKLYSGVIVENYENGQPKLWKQIEQGRAHGLWKEWYQNGNLRYKAEWKEGKGHGYWQYFFENSQLRSEEIYEADINQGIGLHYHRNGQLKKKTYHLDGKKQGIWITNDTTGDPITYQIYNKGELTEEGDYEEN